MALLISQPTTARDAMRITEARGLLPTSLSSREIRDQFSRDLRARSIFSARATSAKFLQGVKNAVIEIQKGIENQATMRLAVSRILQALGYTAADGFGGAEDADIPPAVAGSLQDLRSRRRLDLILETVYRQGENAAFRKRAFEDDRLLLFPCFELVRIYTRRVPRGELDGSLSWPRRWVMAGGKLAPGGRMVARKDSPIWAGLGNSAMFDDALDTEVPPFAFWSGYGWLEVDRAESERLGVIEPGEQPLNAMGEEIPRPKASLVGMDAETARELKESLKAKEDKEGVLTMEDILAEEADNADAIYFGEGEAA